MDSQDTFLVVSHYVYLVLFELICIGFIDLFGDFA